MGKLPLTAVTVPDPGSVPSSRLLIVAVATALLLSLLSLGSSNGVAALSLPIPVIAAPEPAPYDLDQEEEHRPNSKKGETYRLGEEEITQLKQRILEGLGLTRTPDASKVSKALATAPRSCSLEFTHFSCFLFVVVIHLGLTVWPLLYQMFGKPRQSTGAGGGG
jgi:hypothetical protein